MRWFYVTKLFIIISLSVNRILTYLLVSSKSTVEALRTIFVCYKIDCTYNYYDVNYIVTADYYEHKFNFGMENHLFCDSITKQPVIPWGEILLIYFSIFIRHYITYYKNFLYVSALPECHIFIFYFITVCTWIQSSLMVN